MKFTKRMKNAIIQTSVINAFVFLGLTIIIVFYIYPNIQTAVSNVSKLEDVQQKIIHLETYGPTLGEVRASAADVGLSRQPYVQTLLQNTTPDFYATTFENSEGDSYEIFLENISGSIQDEKTSPEFEKKQETLNVILPLYSADGTSSGDLDTFSFVNYIENVLYTFNLRTKGSIGTQNIQKIEQDGISSGTNKNKKSPQSAFEKNIYMIPVSLQLEGRKSDIIDFIHYFQNVGKIEISDNAFRVYNDSFIKKGLYGDVVGGSYNIYENQIGEITSISMREYPDTSTTTDGDLVSRIKSDDQASKRAIADITLGFYVSGIPEYEMQEYVGNVVEKFKTLQNNIQKDIKLYSSKVGASGNGRSLQSLQDLQSMQYLLLNFDSDVQQMQKDLNSSENLEKLYENARAKMLQLQKIEQTHNEIVQILTLEN